jgi:hypothetical protein
MNATEAAPPARNDPFSQRYLLARYPSGGVVVDLASGNYFRVNTTAALVCDALLGNGGVEEAVAEALRISTREAALVVADVVGGLAAPAFRSPPPGAYHFVPSEGGYVLHQEGRKLLEVDRASQTISLPQGRQPEQPALLEFYVRALAPKLLFQRQVTVLHASSCLTENDRVVAFAGLSGAGKTTTARAFAATMRLMSEDLLVFAPETEEPRVLVNAERFIHDWARDIAGALRASPDGVPPGDISSVVRGPTVAVEQILFLDRTRRTGNQFTTRSLDKPDALITFMTHDFLGDSEAATWRRYFATASALVERLETREATAPDGVDRLPAAVAADISKRAS